MKLRALILLFLYAVLAYEGNMLLGQTSDLVTQHAKVDSLKTLTDKYNINQHFQKPASTLKPSTDTLSLLEQSILTDSLKSDSLTDWYQRQQLKIKSFPQSKKEKLHQLDTLKTSFEKRKQKLEEERAQHAAQIEKKTNELESKIEKWKKKLQSKLEPTDSLGLGLGDEIGSQSLLNTGIGEAKIPELKMETPTPNLPDLDLPDSPLNSIDIKDVKIPNTDLPAADLSKPKLPDVGKLGDELNIDELAQAEKTLGEFKALNAKVEKYKINLDSLDREKTQKAAEDAAMSYLKNSDQFKKIEEANAAQLAQVKKLEEMQQQMKQYQDTTYIRQQMERKAKTLANDVIVKNAPQMKNAQGVVRKSQRRYREFSSLNEAKKHPMNSLHGVPFNERFFYGITLQFQKQKYYQFFTNPFVYYRVTGRITFGVGATYRNQYQLKPRFDWITSESLFGARIFNRIHFTRTLYLHVEGERLVRKTAEIKDWSNHLMAGIGKDFRFSRKVGGNFLLLYNFSHDNEEIYPSQLVMRTSICFGRAFRQ